MTLYFYCDNCHWCNGNGCDVCNYTGEELDY